MNKLLKITIIFFISLVNLVFSQESKDVVEPDYIKTIILRPLSPNNYAPIISLGSSFIFSFDDLEADGKDYYYKIEHFDFDWKLSNLSDREFIEGYDEDRIRINENSFNTLQFYTNYSVTFPNKNTRFRISGNYKISVLNDDDEVVFTRRFVLYQSDVTVGVSAHRSRNITTISEKQSVQFIINHPNLSINNPKLEIKTVLMQNNDWNTAIENLQPQFYRGSQMIYKYTDKMDFWAGNEFHYFDNKLVRNSTVTIARVVSGRNLYHTHLYTNIERKDRPYTLYPDVNGNFVVRNLNSDNPNIEADYTWVYFTLESLENIENKRIYVNGSFNNWRSNETNEMVYNIETGLYEAKILLKQGFYNYQYISIDREGLMSNHDIDGSFYQTENEYSVLVYYRKYGSRYDSVIGFGSGSSEEIQH